MVGHTNTPLTSTGRLWGGTWTVLALLLGVLAIAYWRLARGEAFFWGLPALQFVPWRWVAWEQVRAGVVPLINPYNGLGAPLLANYQSALLYPPHWVGLLAPTPPALGWLMSVTAVLHLAWAGVGMLMFTRRLGLPVLGQGVSALAFALCGYAVARLGTFPTVTVYAWLPWLLWAVTGVAYAPSRWRVAWLGGVVALLLLGGHAQTAWYSLLLAGLWSLWHAVTLRAWRGLAASLAGVLLGAGLAAAQLLPTTELLRQSPRADGVDEAFALNFSYAPVRALNLLAPNVFGNPGDGSYITQGAYFEDAVYVGIVPLLGALAALVTWGVWRVRGRPNVPARAALATVPFWVGVLLIGGVLALGRHTPVFPWLYTHVPTFDLFQAPVRWHLWTVCALCVLAGVGVCHWGRGYWALFATRLATAAALGAIVLAWVVPARVLPPEVAADAGVQVLVRAVISAGVWAVLAGLLTLAQPGVERARWQPVWGIAVLLVVAADVGWAARGLNPTVPAAFYAPQPADADSGLLWWPPDVLEAVMYGQWLHFDDYRVAQQGWRQLRASRLPNLNALDGMALLNTFDPLVTAEHAARMGALAAAPSDAQTGLLAALGVDGVVTAERVVPLPGTPSAVVPGTRDARTWWLGLGISLTSVTLLALVCTQFTISAGKRRYS